MASTTDINLIKRSAGGAFGPFAGYEEKSRVIAWWSLLSLFGAGIIIGAVYLAINARLHQLETKKLQLTQRINAAQVKEGIIISLKQRIVVAQKAIDAARPWGKLFPMLEQIAPVAQFSTVTIDDSGRVSTTLEVQTIDEAVTAVANTINLFATRSLRSPQLLSLSLRESGEVRVALSFIPIF